MWYIEIQRGIASRSYLVGLVAIIAVLVYITYTVSRTEIQQDNTMEGSRHIDVHSNYSNVRYNVEPAEQLKKRLPGAIIAGVMKSGTKALLMFLSKHPYIAAMLNPPEAHYFNINYDKPLSWYKNLMPYSYQHQITMEKTPAYFSLSNAPALIKKMNSSTKIILIFKEPIIRAQSQFLMTKRKHKNVKATLEETVIVQGKNSTRVVDWMSPFIGNSKYDEKTSVWQAVFPSDQLCFVDGQAIERDPVKELARIETFLNIPHYLTDDKFVYNASKGNYCMAEEDEGAMSCLEEVKGVYHPKINKKDMKILQDYFKPHNEGFFKLIGRRFDWGY